MKIISVRETPNRAKDVINYIQQAWSEVLPIMYEDSITHCIGAKNPLPQWYVLEKDGKLVGCAGLVPNDFNSRMELYPWLCALYVDEAHRSKGYAKLLMDKAGEDASKHGFKNLYLCTDHDSYYERYGFEYIGQCYHPWDEETRVYQLEL